MSPSYLHAYLQSKLSGVFLKLDEYSVFSELTLDIDGQDYTPDISLYPKRSVNWLQDRVKMSEMPLLAVEISSPTQRMQKLLDKFSVYFQAGVKSCWLVVPATQTVLVCAGLDEARSFSNQEIRDDVLGIKLSFEDVFG